jgi:hypothetical protein
MSTFDEFQKKFEAAQEQAKPRRQARGGADRRQRHARKNGGTAHRVLSPPAVPMAVARQFVAECCTHDNTPTLRHWRASWWRWESSRWVELEDRAVRSSLYQFTTALSTESSRHGRPRGARSATYSRHS